MRWLVVGTSGCGKSTLARALAAAQGADYVELDELFWGPGWKKRATADFIAGVREATRGERWVADGNYSVVRTALWPRATHVVWLDFGRATVLARIVGRTSRRVATQEPMWHGNRESVGKAFFSRESIIWWSITTFDKNRRKYAALREDAAWAHLSWVVLRSPREARAFLESMQSPAAAGQMT